MDDDFKLPRLFIDAPLSAGGTAVLSPDQAHYLKNVLRRGDSDLVRVFNGRNGEWRGPLKDLSKKGGTVVLETHTRAQPAHTRRIHLYFAPIKKTAMDWMIEKAVELGATDLHPVLTHNTEVRKINADRLTKQVFEAAEQCERLEIPVLHDLAPLSGAFKGESPIFACIERQNAAEIGKSIPNMGDVGLLIGPEGGFTAEEKAFLTENSRITPVSLGESVLRAETAACFALIAAQLA
jgi:16S rRNA (uracil1498-N3)-methyltransferase